jgi:hypothetical protein
LWVIFALLDPDPLSRLNPDPIRIRIRIRIRNPDFSLPWGRIYCELSVEAQKILRLSLEEEKLSSTTDTLLGQIIE